MKLIPESTAITEHTDLSGKLGRRYVSIRQFTEGLAAPLSSEDCSIQSMPDASPVKWHLAHTTWFFETFVLAPHCRGYRTFDAAYRVLFNSYYNTVGEKHPRAERGMLSRPGLKEIIAYRRHVDEAMVAFFAMEHSPEEVAELIELGLQHEQQHQELILTDLKHLLSRNPLKPAYQKQWPLTPIRARERKWIFFDAGMRQIGHIGARLLLRQRDAAPSRLARCISDRLASGDSRGFHRVHRRRWLSAAGVVALVRVGRRHCPRVARPPVLGAA